jgi:hypothetical protein
MNRRALRDAALGYADRGWHVIPLRPRAKPPLGQLVPNGLRQATTDLATVLGWWTRAPQANVGLVAGVSGWIALDVDPRNGGDDDLHELEGQAGKLPKTVSAETGGGGWHYLFQHPGGDLRGKLGDGLDVKDAGYIVAPPSIHPSGRPYSWDLSPDDVPLAELPPAWVERVRQPIHVARSADLALRGDHDDPLRRVLADTYVPRLARREVHRGGWVQCPFHKGGAERTPSLKVDGVLWACHACSPMPGKRSFGGNIYDFAGLLAGYALPLRGPDFLDVQGRLRRALR